MAQLGTRIPAWKRLGLKLHKSNQSDGLSQAQEPSVGEHQRDDAAGGRRASPLPSVVPTGGGNARLGKRKHQNDGAEGDGETFKRSRKSQGTEGANGHAVLPASAPPERDNVERVPAMMLTDGSHPKGDPNYRRKKGKESSWKGKSKAKDGSVCQQNNGERTNLSPENSGSAGDRPTLLVSTETDSYSTPPGVSPNGFANFNEKAVGDTESGLTPQIDRRKSVTFTPDTKTVDGNSAANYFKKWAQEQKGSNAEFTAAEFAQFVPPPKVHPANHAAVPDPVNTTGERKAKRSKKELKTSTSNSVELAPTLQTQQPADTSTTSKKKDPARYLSYLTQYYNDRPNWKFNKAKQNDVLTNSLNIFRIPNEHSDALIEYVKGLKGGGVIDRLKERCNSTLEEIDAAEKQEASTMDDREARKGAQDEALQERLWRERKRRRLEGDIENMIDHPHSESYIRRLKRGRAQALLKALSLAAPAPAPTKPPQQGGARPNSALPGVSTVLKRNSQKRKRRADISSDESSDSSSSEESSDSSDDEDGSESGSGSDLASDASSEGGSASEGNSSSDSVDSTSESSPEAASSDSEDDD